MCIGVMAYGIYPLVVLMRYGKLRFQAAEITCLASLLCLLAVLIYEIIYIFVLLGRVDLIRIGISAVCPGLVFSTFALLKLSTTWMQLARSAESLSSYSKYLDCSKFIVYALSLAWLVVTIALWYSKNLYVLMALLGAVCLFLTALLGFGAITMFSIVERPYIPEAFWAKVCYFWKSAANRPREDLIEYTRKEVLRGGELEDGTGTPIKLQKGMNATDIKALADKASPPNARLTQYGSSAVTCYSQLAMRLFAWRVLVTAKRVCFLMLLFTLLIGILFIFLMQEKFDNPRLRHAHQMVYASLDVLGILQQYVVLWFFRSSYKIRIAKIRAGSVADMHDDMPWTISVMENSEVDWRSQVQSLKRTSPS